MTDAVDRESGVASPDPEGTETDSDSDFSVDGYTKEEFELHPDVFEDAMALDDILEFSSDDDRSEDDRDLSNIVEESQRDVEKSMPISARSDVAQGDEDAETPIIIVESEEEGENLVVFSQLGDKIRKEEDAKVLDVIGESLGEENLLKISAPAAEVQKDDVRPGLVVSSQTEGAEPVKPSVDAEIMKETAKETPVRGGNSLGEENLLKISAPAAEVQKDDIRPGLVVSSQMEGAEPVKPSVDAEIPIVEAERKGVLKDASESQASPKGERGSMYGSLVIERAETVFGSCTAISESAEGVNVQDTLQGPFSPISAGSSGGEEVVCVTSESGKNVDAKSVLRAKRAELERKRRELEQLRSETLKNAGLLPEVGVAKDSALMKYPATNAVPFVMPGAPLHEEDSSNASGVTHNDVHVEALDPKGVSTLDLSISASEEPAPADSGLSGDLAGSSFSPSSIETPRDLDEDLEMTCRELDSEDDEAAPRNLDDDSPFAAPVPSHRMESGSPVVRERNEALNTPQILLEVDDAPLRRYQQQSARVQEETGGEDEQKVDSWESVERRRKQDDLERALEMAADEAEAEQGQEPRKKRKPKRERTFLRLLGAGKKASAPEPYVGKREERPRAQSFSPNRGPLPAHFATPKEFEDIGQTRDGNDDALVGMTRSVSTMALTNVGRPTSPIDFFRPRPPQSDSNFLSLNDILSMDPTVVDAQLKAAEKKREKIAKAQTPGALKKEFKTEKMKMKSAMKKLEREQRKKEDQNSSKQSSVRNRRASSAPSSPPLESSAPTVSVPVQAMASPSQQRKLHKLEKQRRDSHRSREVQSAEKAHIIWGKLVPLNLVRFQHIHLIEFRTLLGRGSHCKHGCRFDSHDISSKHCIVRLERSVGFDGEPVYLVWVDDLSSKGTFVNGRLIGKGKRSLLKDGDELSLGTPGFADKATFSEETISYRFHSSLEKLVSRKIILPPRRVGHSLDTPESYILLLRFEPIPKHIDSLRDLIKAQQLQPERWIKKFVELGGLDVLGSIIQSAEAKSKKTDLEMEILEGALGCISYLMNTSVGLQAALDSEIVLNRLVLLIDSPSVRTRRKIPVLFAAVCLYSQQGHQMVLMALVHFAEIRRTGRARGRFQYLVHMLSVDDDIVFTTQILTLINAMVNTPASLEERVSLRKEFMNLDLLLVVERLSEKASAEDLEMDSFDEWNRRLQLQIRVFIEEMTHDQELIIYQKTDVSNPSMISQAIMGRIINPQANDSFLKIMQYLMLLPGETLYDVKTWQLIEDVVEKIVLGHELDDKETRSLTVEEVKSVLDRTIDLRVIGERMHERVDERVLLFAEVEKQLRETEDALDQLKRQEKERVKVSEEKIARDGQLLFEMREEIARLRTQTVSSVKEIPASVPSVSAPVETAPPPPPPPPPAPVGPGEDADVGGPPPPPPPPGPPAPGDEGSGPPPPPPPGAPSFGSSRLPKRKYQKPSVAMRPLHWVRLPKMKVADTVWTKIEDSGFQVDPTEFESLFAMKALKPKATASAGTPVPTAPKVVYILDMKRSNNIGIFVARLPLSPPLLKNAIVEMKVDAFEDEDFVVSLINHTATEEELASLRAYNGEVSMLGSAEKFCLLLGAIPRLHERLRCLSTILGFNQKCLDIEKDLKTVRDACTAVMENPKLRGILEVILVLGNYMNAKAMARKEAIGFKVDFLAKLADCRSVDNKTNLLRYVVHVCSTRAKYADLLDFPADMEAVKIARSKPLKQISAAASALSVEVSLISEEIHAVKKLKRLPKDQFLPSMEGFVNVAKARMSDIRDTLKNVQEVTVGVLKAYGEDPEKMMDCTEQFFGYFSDFATSFERALLDHAKDEEKKEKQRKEEARQVARVQAKGEREKQSKQRPSPKVVEEEDQSTLLNQLYNKMQTGNAFHDRSEHVDMKDRAEMFQKFRRLSSNVS